MVTDVVRRRRLLRPEPWTLKDKVRVGFVAVAALAACLIPPFLQCLAANRLDTSLRINHWTTALALDAREISLVRRVEEAFHSTGFLSDGHERSESDLAKHRDALVSSIRPELRHKFEMDILQRGKLGKSF